MRCLIVDEMHAGIVPGLEKLGIQVDYQPNIQRKEIIQCIGLYQGLILRSKTNIDSEILSKTTQLKFVARAGAGTDNIDEQAMEKMGITLINAPEGNRDTLAEHTIALILSLTNNIVKSDTEVRKKQWKRSENMGDELKGKTVAIYGYGNMGQAVAKRLPAFEVNILAYDKYKSGFSNSTCKEADIDQIFSQADILTLHLPLTSETQNLVNRSFLNKFKKPIYLINTSRGEILSEKALMYHLEKNNIKGAGLVVLANEKLETLTPEEEKTFAYLSGSPKTIITPHIGGWSKESYKRISEVLIAKIKVLFF